MSERRMFTEKITESDAFLEMPLSSQALYFHYCMNADDDGFVKNPKRIQKMLGASDDDGRLLVLRKFVLPFDSGVIVIKHWRMHNLLRKDRYKPTEYIEEKSQLYLKENGSYTFDETQGQNLLATSWQPNDNQLAPQDSIGKDSIVKDSIKEEIIKEEKHKYGEYGWFLLTDKEKERLDKEFGKEYIDKVITILDEQVQSTKNKNKYKDWNLVIRKAIRDKWSCLNTIKTTPTTTEPKIDYNKKFGKVY